MVTVCLGLCRDRQLDTAHELNLAAGGQSGRTPEGSQAKEGHQRT